MLLLVGLGNPGREHEQDRHNIGFMAVDEIVRRHGFSAPRSRFQGLVSEGTVSGEKILALKPMTFMNESGRSVAEAQRFYKLDPDQIIVFHDEIDLVAGKVRVKRGGGAAGHNGIRSLDSHIGKEYWRVRLGIGHPGDPGRVHGHVLGKFNKADAAWRDPLIEAAADAFPDLVADDPGAFMNRIATALRPPPPKTAPPGEQKDPPQQGQAPEPKAIDTGKVEQGPTDTDSPANKGTTLGGAFSAAFARLRKPQQK